MTPRFAAWRSNALSTEGEQVPAECRMGARSRTELRMPVGPVTDCKYNFAGLDGVRGALVELRGTGAHAGGGDGPFCLRQREEQRVQRAASVLLLGKGVKNKVQRVPGVGRLKESSGRPIANRPQDTILPHIAASRNHRVDVAEG